MKSRKRLVYFFVIVAIALVVMCFRVGWIQIVNGGEYKQKAMAQQTKTTTVVSKRGTIYDRNGHVLAMSADTYAIWARPTTIPKKELDKTAGTLSKILSLDKDDLKKQLSQERSLIKIDKGLEYKIAQKIKEEKLIGIEITSDVTRYYPASTLASQLLGNVSEDNEGLAGLELQYNDVLKGSEGKEVSTTDRNGNILSYGQNDYNAAKDGCSIVSTIDSVVQNRVERIINKGKKSTSAKKVTCMIMDPETGNILASASTENYNPNNPRVPLDDAEANNLKNMNSQEQFEYLNKMWRNPLVSDTYPPGSTFKLLTLCAALEEGKSSLGDHFFDSGTYQVSGQTLKCWSFRNPHGDETLKQAVSNSCNPVFIQLGQRLGVSKFYKYLNGFGITGTTGVDYPGEASAIIRKEKGINPIDFATMTYGQGIAVTPIQVLTIASTIGNEGVLMQPKLVQEIKTEKGKTVKTIEDKKVRQVVSKDTAHEAKEAMRYTVEEGGGKAAKVAGYKTGGKTGTAQNEMTIGKGQDTYYASFVGLAPIDDPKVALIVIVDDPKGRTHGSEAAAPIAKEINEFLLPYIGAKPTESK
ncbi:MAG: penicillin-binding transpeptidase domain-containing protein [Anaerovoracaceae bacterium]